MKFIHHPLISKICSFRKINYSTEKQIHQFERMVWFGYREQSQIFNVLLNIHDTMAFSSLYGTCCTRVKFSIFYLCSFGIWNNIQFSFRKLFKYQSKVGNDEFINSHLTGILKIILFCISHNKFGFDHMFNVGNRGNSLKWMMCSKTGIFIFYKILKICLLNILNNNQSSAKQRQENVFKKRSNQDLKPKGNEQILYSSGIWIDLKQFPT